MNGMRVGQPFRDYCGRKERRAVSFRFLFGRVEIGAGSS